MAAALAVARQFAILAEAEEEPEYLTHLRIQKLLYYAQAWSLVQRDKPLFEDRIEAWSNGPVVKNVYQILREHDRKPIGSTGFPDDVGQALDAEEENFVASVWEAYKGHSASGLWRMTHEESPWINARRGHGPNDRCSEEITNDAMRAYFASAGD